MTCCCFFTDDICVCVWISDDIETVCGGEKFAKSIHSSAAILPLILVLLIVGVGALCRSKAFSEVGVIAMLRVSFCDDPLESIQPTIDLRQIWTVRNADELFAGRMDNVSTMSWVDVEADAGNDDGFLFEQVFEHY